MGNTEKRVTGFFLSIIIFLAGIGSSVLLYLSGQSAIDAFWGNNALYKDEKGWIHHRDVTDDWYGRLILRAWALGFVYVVPGLTGIIASLTFTKAMMIQHFVLAILALTIGSVVHTTGGAALILYRVLMIQGVQKYDPWLGDCIYVNDNPLIGETYIDEQCLKGRKALLLAIAALGTLCVGWIFVLSHMLYCAFTFSSVLISQKPKGTSSANKDVKRSDYTQLEDDTLSRRCTCREHSRYPPGQYRRRGKRVSPPVPPPSQREGLPDHNVEANTSPQPSTSNAYGNYQTSNSIYPMQELHAPNTTDSSDKQQPSVFSTFPPSTQASSTGVASAIYSTANEENTNNAELYHPQSFFPDQETEPDRETVGTLERYDESLQVTTRDIDIDVAGTGNNSQAVEQSELIQSEAGGIVNEGYN